MRLPWIAIAVLLAAPLLAAPNASPLVTFRPGDNMLLVQGKPFFPIGIYESPGTEKYLQRLADAGFNLCHVPGGASPRLPELLDMTSRHGMKAWISTSTTLDFSADREKKEQQLRDMVGVVGKHPGLLCWESMDEPVWGKQNADAYLEGYRFLKQLDPDRPVWTNHAPRNTIEELAHFNRATDIAGCDIYPVPDGAGHSDIPNKTISVVGDETDKNRKAVDYKKPIFMVLQGFGWRELSAPDPADPPVMPTFAESRFMAYDAIVHGANGILYWGTHYTKKPSRFWSELRSLTSELALLRNVLASKTVPMPVSKAVRPGERVRAIEKRLNGFTYLIFVNENSNPAKQTISGLKAKRMRRLFEGRNYAVSNGAVTFDLAGYDVAVLTDNLKFPDKRKDYSAEWQNAVTPPVLTEPGNLLRNAGFEVDVDEDGIPDDWNPSTALTASMTQEAHSGKYALRLEGLGGDLGPLAVQRAVDVRLNNKYRFSAWVKTEGTPEVRFYIEWTTDGWYGGVLPWTKGTGEWQQLQLEFEAKPDPQGGAYAVVQLKGEGAATFDDVRLEEIP